MKVFIDCSPVVLRLCIDNFTRLRPDDCYEEVRERPALGGGQGENLPPIRHVLHCIRSAIGCHRHCDLHSTARLSTGDTDARAQDQHMQFTAPAVMQELWKGLIVLGLSASAYRVHHGNAHLR